MQIDDDDGSLRGERGHLAARDRLVAVAVHDAMLILDDLERRNAIDGGRAADIRWSAIRITGDASADETARFWAGYAELVVLSERLGSAAKAAMGAVPAQLPAAAPRRLRLWQAARYGAMAATLCALVFAANNVTFLTAPRQDEPPPIAVASRGPVASAVLDTTTPLAAAVYDTEPTYLIGYGTDHPNFPQPVGLQARYDPPQGGI